MPAIVSIDLIEIAVFGEFSPEERPSLSLGLHGATAIEWAGGYPDLIGVSGPGGTFTSTCIGSVFTTQPVARHSYHVVQQNVGRLLSLSRHLWPSGMLSEDFGPSHPLHDFQSKSPLRAIGVGCFARPNNYASPMSRCGIFSLSEVGLSSRPAVVTCQPLNVQGCRRSFS